MANDLQQQMREIHSELVFGVIPSEIDKLIKKYSSSASIKQNLAQLKDYIFITLCDMCAGIAVEDAVYEINKLKSAGKDNKTIAEILHLKPENVDKLLMGWDAING